MSIYINNKTGIAVERKAPTEEEYVYDGKPMILETDEKRNVTYANKRFVEASGYSKEEIIGAPHCMHMHPDMPAVIFENACKMNDEGLFIADEVLAKHDSEYMPNELKDVLNKEHTPRPAEGNVQ